jgi:hypothetical protein
MFSALAYPFRNSNLHITEGLPTRFVHHARVYRRDGVQFRLANRRGDVTKRASQRTVLFFYARVNSGRHIEFSPRQ